jgi:hypothetical protein
MNVNPETTKRINMKILINICIGAVFFLSSCSHWKVSELNSKKIFTLESGSEIKQVLVQIGDSDLLDISFTLNASRDKFFIADNKSKRLQVIDMDGKVIGQIGPKKYDQLLMSATFAFGIIGSVASDTEGKIYVQNRIDASQGQRTEQQGDIEIASSYILVFDKTGKLQYSLGQKGPADIPFNYIEKIFVDGNERLFVITKNYETWGVYRFKSRVRDFFITLGKDSFKETEGASEYNGVIENIVPFKEGNRFLLSVAYYSNTRFKYRKIIEYNVDENRLGKVILNLPDPKNELYSILDDKYLLLWDTEEKNLRYAIWDLNGNIVNNFRIKMDNRSSYLNQIFTDESGRIFTYTVKKTGIDVMEWK